MTQPRVLIARGDHPLDFILCERKRRTFDHLRSLDRFRGVCWKPTGVVNKPKKRSKGLEFLFRTVVFVGPGFAKLTEGVDVAFIDVHDTAVIGKRFQLLEEESVFIDAWLAELA